MLILFVNPSGLMLSLQAVKSPENFAQHGLRPTQGLLLSGPPGTGKTTLLKAAARHFKGQGYHVMVSKQSKNSYLLTLFFLSTESYVISCTIIHTDTERPRTHWTFGRGKRGESQVCLPS